MKGNLFRILIMISMLVIGCPAETIFSNLKYSLNCVKTSFHPVKNNGFTRFGKTGGHVVLAGLYVLMPFLFSETLLEKETTLRFMGLAGICLIAFSVLLLSIFSRATVRMPPLLQSPFFQMPAAWLLYSAWSLTQSRNQGEAVYDFLKLPVACTYALLLLLLLCNHSSFLKILGRYMNVAVWIFLLIALSQLGNSPGKGRSFQLDFSLASSLGNKNFFAETLALFLPFVLMAAVLHAGWWRRASALSAALIVFSILALQSLSAWVALGSFMFIAIIALPFIYAKKEKAPAAPVQRKNIFRTAAFVLLAIAALAFIFRWSGGFGLIGERLAKLQEYTLGPGKYTQENIYQQNSIAERMYLWKNAWGMFKDHPLTGAGYDNWKIYSARYGLPFYEKGVDVTVRFMRPHNDLLLLLAEEGLMGFLLYLLPFLYAFGRSIYLLRRLPERQDRLVVLLSASGLLMYLFIACFSLPGDRFYTQVLLGQSFCLLWYYSRRDRLVIAGKASRALLGLPAISFSLALIVVGSQRYASEIHLVYAMQAQHKSDWRKMSYHAGVAKKFYFPMDFTGTPLAWYQGIAAFNSGQYGTARYFFEEAIKVNPYHLQVINDLASCENELGDTASAMHLYNQALILSPYFSNAYLNKAVLVYNSGARDSAFRFLLRYPIHNEDYIRLMRQMLAAQVASAFQDSNKTSAYLHRPGMDLYLCYKLALARHMTFSDFVLQDSLPARSLPH